ncbi:G-type lectin S-receptor-like serine/threonine-protein kinase [Sesamum alatum]|uniref:Receptor-like serine/threonine-protein kinase n=1 Tax=Sesamum alatum TaxID=300844 RepID=A0AAE1YYM2_9LAMI|nr:G-type lectin S-receptor-like serine/threonine-protein kinase [Sesamum alatum]
MSPAKIKLLYYFLVLLISVFVSEISVCNGLDTIRPGQFLSGNQTLSSQNGTFELGFFSPGASGNYYIGIWYTISLPNKTVVWVANREQPVSDPSYCQLKLLQDGNLVLLNQSKTRIWSTNSDREAANSTVVMLLDNGNLIIKDALDLSNVLWQSFDYPTDHWLPGGKVGRNKLMNLKQKLTPWRSAENPAANLFSVEVEENGTSHVLMWNQTKLYWSTGEWNGQIFQFVPEIALNRYIKNLRYVDNENESYFTYELGVPGVLTRFLIDSTGQLKQFIWGVNFTMWASFWARPSQQCEVYAYCGAFSSCNNMERTLCKCLPGFQPTVPKNWMLEDHTDGCIRKSPLQCDGEDVYDTFSVVSKVRFPDDAVILPLSNASDCRLACLRNCSCSAHAYDDGRCLHWIGDLFSTLQLPSDDTTGRDIYIRISASDQEVASGGKSKSRTVWIIVGATAGICIIIILIVLVIRRRRKSRKDISEPLGNSLMLFKFRDLRAATKNFSEKLGEGGFGCVFKGTLPSSSVIAVKRLKNISQEKDQEKQFRAEVSTIGTIQHINLVPLRGSCLKDSTKFLVYDYFVNGSIDSKLFSKDSKTLDWKTRYKIAIGTARGLAYLHEKCRDCIIHCDIKPENILLDTEFNPKIADFGLAKLLGREFSRVLTTARGTRGYLAPEWISGEPITSKADVFSFGMLLLEMVSGRRNRDETSTDGSNDYFPARVAKTINNDEEVMSLLDQRLEGRADEEEVSRVCKVGCWCIQDEEKNRPSMGHVVQILEGLSEVAVYPIPKFLEGFVDGNTEPIAFMEGSSSSTLSV